jgi:hypothetical protein
MTATDKKRRRLASAIGESFAAIRRRTARSPAWLSLSAPALKLYVELRLNWRHKDPNSNGDLYVSLIDAEKKLRLSRPRAVRGFAELEAKGFIVKTRKGEAGRLPRSATTENGGVAHSRRATRWALTDEPYNCKPPTHAYEKLTDDDLRRIDRELRDRFQKKGTASVPKEQFDVYGVRTHLSGNR